MPTKPFLTQLNPALVSATCICSLLLSPGKMLGATLTLNSDTSFTDAVNLIDTDTGVDSLIGAESVTAESLSLVNNANSELALGGGLPNESSEESANASLSLQSIIGTLGQIKLEGRGNQGEIPEVLVLPQVNSSDVFKEVYDFTPKVPRKSPEPIRGISFSAKTFSPVPSLGTGISAVQNLGSSGFVGNLGGLSNPLKLDSKVDARFGILPGGNPHLTLKDINQGLSSVAQTLDQYDPIKSNSSLMPKTTLSMELKLTQYQEGINRRQNEFQQKIKQNFEEQKRRQEQLEQEMARRQQEQQQRLFQEQQERQRQQQQQQLAQQLEQQRQQQEQLARQLEQQRQQQQQF